MKKIYVLSFVAIASLLMLNACGDKTDKKKTKVATVSKEDLKSAIGAMQDSLETLQSSGKKIRSLHRIELINRLLSFYRSYPEDMYSAECLDKAQMIYSTMEAPEYAVAYCDTLLIEYPKYKNRALVLESQGANYDIFVTPRDSAMVRKYYTILLDEFPDMDIEKRKGIIKRLKNNHLTFDEYLMKL